MIGRARAIQLLQKVLMFETQKMASSNLSPGCVRRSSSSYVTQMRKSSIDANTLRLLRNEIQYEVDRSPLQQPPSEINGFKVDERPGEHWISLEKQFGENEVIKLEVTMFDGSVHVPNQGEKPGLPGQDVQLHISMIVSIFKNNSNQVLEFVCSAWPDTIAISKLFVRQQAKVPLNPYTGPKFRELDDELQNSLYEFLEERQIDDTLCVFLHNYVNYKEKAEHIRWMNSVKSVMEK
ncbi:uncharacterized protein At2g39795, mitochondrial-like [Chenopodium quinoa]|uniref:uncharacterized protein At2g39795, mitochondrial-like n=1 Tax=Chenopodium quinoa TaxID=63459 RepID=UPI000B76CF03|nr:uncharacterized protein At2g39795, mitochondrial-like [Chenopodium quinoa]